MEAKPHSLKTSDTRIIEQGCTEGPGGAGVFVGVLRKHMGVKKRLMGGRRSPEVRRTAPSCRGSLLGCLGGVWALPWMLRLLEGNPLELMALAES